MIEFVRELREIGHLYLYYILGQKNVFVIILRVRIHPQELTLHILIDLASHVELILSPKHWQPEFTTKELDL